MENTPQKVLVVDDSPVNVQILNGILHQQYRVFFATSGEEALRLIPNLNPDIILLDIMMPGIDGYEVCRTIREDLLLRDIPIIFITALSEHEDETRGLDLGAVDYIRKPFNPNIVRLRIRNHLELKRQRDLLSRLSFIDGLTGIGNRRAFDETLDREWKRAVRSHQPISIMIIDIDFFKLYNDTYGHLTGDNCLRKIASCISGSLKRPSDSCMRYGGEEFICILPDTGSRGAETLAEKIRTTVTDERIPHEQAPLGIVSVSIGIASSVCDADLSSAALTHAADMALYDAKNSGRNCIVSKKIPEIIA